MENLPTILTEIDEIETVLATDRPRYNRDLVMQARYRGLLEEREGSASSGFQADSGPLLPIASQQEFHAATKDSGVAYGDYVKTMRSAADWVFALPAAEQKGFIAGFEALPDAVAHAAIGEILATWHPLAPASSPRAVAAFAELPEGAILTREWGEAAGRNLALVRARLFRVVDAIPERHVGAFYDWLDGLSRDCAVALYRKLAA